MAEEKEEKKKQSIIIKQIFKWIGLVALSILLIGAIVFAAPWKVTTLLVIILAACTILPKPYRKYFWLSVVAVVIALIIWVFLPEETEGWRPYTFDEELAAMEAKYAIPDGENAAKIYEQLLTSYDANDFEPNFVDVDFWDLVRSGPWGSEDHPEAADWLKGHQNTIDSLMEAAKKEKCHFPVQADPISIGHTLDRLSPMRRWAYLLISAGNNDIAEGRVDEGLEKYIAVLQMAKHQYQQPTIIEMLVGIAVEALAIRQFNRFVVTDEATEEHLNIIEEALGEIRHDWNRDLSKFIEHEKLFVKNHWGMFYGINSEGKIRLNPGVAIRAMMAQLPEEMKDEMVITYWHKRAIKAWTILCWFFVPSTPQKAGEIIDDVYKKYYAMADPNFDWKKEAVRLPPKFRLNYHYMIKCATGVLKEPYCRVHDLYLRAIAQQRGSQIIIFLRRYKNKTGQWPEGLDDIQSLVSAETLVDPFNNGSFVYRLTEENFTLYSKGKNGINEQGRYDATHGIDLRNVKRFSVDEREDDWLIWPPKKGRGAREEQAGDE